MITRLFDVREGLTRIDAELIHVLLGEVPLNQLHELCDDDGEVELDRDLYEQWEEEWIDVLERSNYDECDLPNLLPLSELAEYRLANAAHVIGYALTQGVPFPLPPMEEGDPTELSVEGLDYKEAASILKGWCKQLKLKLPTLTGMERDEVLELLVERINGGLPEPYKPWLRLGIEVTDEPIEVCLEWTVGDWKRQNP